ncbi:3-isopropylmalate dehydrogenase, partial [Hungatella hathewayi]
NWKKYKEGRDMCNALEELFADKLEEREKLGMEQGIERGIEQGIRAFVLDHIEEGTPQNIILQKLEKRFSLSPEQAEEYCCRFREG